MANRKAALLQVADLMRKASEALVEALDENTPAAAPAGAFEGLTGGGEMMTTPTGAQIDPALVAPANINADPLQMAQTMLTSDLPEQDVSVWQASVTDLERIAAYAARNGRPDLEYLIDRISDKLDGRIASSKREATKNRVKEQFRARRAAAQTPAPVQTPAPRRQRTVARPQ